MNVEVITIGTELLLGEIVDTNSAYITRLLRDIGVNIYCLTTIGDNLKRIEDAVRIALTRAEVVITTGGLGPTVDDMTREAVANATNCSLEFRPELFEQIRERFNRLGAKMSENNRVQAYIPAGSIAVDNPWGTAPCFITETEQGTVISLPGVPHEMKNVMERDVVPYLRARMGGKGIIKARVLRTAGIGESQVDARIADLETWSNPTVGLAAHVGQTDIRITARADNETEADELIAKAEEIIRERVGNYIYGMNKDLLEDALVDLLREKGLALAVSYNGPEEMAFIERFHDDPVLVGKVCDAELNTLLTRLGYAVDTVDPERLDYGELAKAEVQRLLAESGSDVGIAYVTHDTGTGITAMLGEKVYTRHYRFGSADDDIPVGAGTWVISMAWRLVRRMDVE